MKGFLQGRVVVLLSVGPSLFAVPVQAKNANLKLDQGVLKQATKSRPMAPSCR